MFNWDLIQGIAVGMEMMEDDETYLFVLDLLIVRLMFLKYKNNIG